MSITIVKKPKPATSTLAQATKEYEAGVKSAQANTLSDLAADIDTVGRQQIEAIPILKKIEALRAQLAPLAESVKLLTEKLKAYDDPEQNEQCPNPDQPLVLLGESFRLEAGKRTCTRVIRDMDAVKKALGTKTFMAVAKVALKDIDNYLTEQERAPLLDVEYGSRRFEVVPRPEAMLKKKSA